jgi:hypothetical protein
MSKEHRTSETAGRLMKDVGYLDNILDDLYCWEDNQDLFTKATINRKWNDLEKRIKRAYELITEEEE